MTRLSRNGILPEQRTSESHGQNEACSSHPFSISLERIAELESDLRSKITVEILATLEDQIQTTVSQAVSASVRTLLQPPRDPVLPDTEAGGPPPAADEDDLQAPLLSTEIVTGKAASKASRNTVVCPSKPPASRYQSIRKESASFPDRAHTPGRPDVSTAPTSAAEIDPWPLHESSEARIGDSTDYADNFDAGDLTEVGDSADDDDDDDDDSDGDYIDGVDSIDDVDCADDVVDERVAARSNALVRPTRATNPSAGASRSNTGVARPIVQVQINAARPQHYRPPGSSPSVFSPGSRLSRALREAATTRTPNSSSGTKRAAERVAEREQVVYPAEREQIVYPAENPLRKRPCGETGKRQKHC